MCSHGEDNREDTAGEKLSKDKQTGPDQDPQVRICDFKARYDVFWSVSQKLFFNNNYNVFVQ